MHKVIVSLFIAGALMACESGKQEAAGEGAATEDQETRYSLKMDMLGEWTNIAMKVRIDGTEGDSVIDVPEGKWSEILQIKPIRTTFSEDGTYTSEYRDLNDTVIMTRNGTWSVKGDSLTMGEEGSTYSYATTISGNMAEFEGYIDWDEDGEADDLYWGTQRKTVK